MSTEFKEFARTWMFRHTTASPYHHRSNGMAESAVKMAKTLLRKAIHEGSDAWLALLHHCNTPSMGFDTSPAQRLFSRRTQGMWPLAEQLLKPEVTMDKDKEAHKHQQEKVKGQGKSLRPLPVGTEVWIQPLKPGQQWMPAVVLRQREEPRSYDVQAQNG